MAAALRLDEERTARLFSGRPVVLRRDLDAATAFRRAARFAELGARLRIEPPPGEPAPLDAVARVLPLASGITGATEPAAPADPAAVTAAAAEAAPRVPSPVERPRRATTAVLGVAVVVVGGIAGVAWAPHLRAWLWAAAPVPATAPAATPSATNAASATAAASTAAASVAPAPPPAIAPPPATAAAAAAPPAATTTSPTVVPPPQSAGMPAFVRTMSPEARFDYGGPYSTAPPVRAFAISADGAHGWTAATPTENQARAGALERCYRTKPARSGCRVVDVNGVAQE